MHQYLRAIGFSNIHKRDLEKIIFNIRKDPDYHQSALDTQGNEFVELRREIAPGVGLAIRGSYDDNGHFETDYYFPYCYGRQVSTDVPIEIVRESARESFLGLCDDLRLGIDLIFHVQDMLSILESEQRNNQLVNFGGTMLGALSTEGKIIMPIFSTANQVENIRRYSKKHLELLNAAKEGDEDAYEKLALDDMDTYAMVSDRMEQEDLYSIVTTYFMPNGIESDKYSILGEILDCKRIVNHRTADNMYILKVECNEIVFDVCINSKDLFGEPAIGRRFKGSIWMQGRACPQPF